MKILVDVRPLGKHPSGIGMYLYHFIWSLKRYEDIHIEVITDVAESEEIQNLESTQIPIHRYGKHIARSAGVYAYFYFVQKKIYEVRPDIFWEGNNLLPLKIKNPYGKVVVTVHDVFPITMPEAYGRIYPYYFKFYLKRTVKNADAILYDSIETRKEAERVVPQAGKKESFVSYIAVDVEPKTKISDDGYFLYIGNLERRKGTDILLCAYKLYREHGGERSLVLAGKMREKEIQELYEQICKDTEGITYAGYIDEQQKDELLARCGCFVFPSRAEGFGIPVIEAFSYGKPVIGSDLSIFKEITGGQLQSFLLDASTEKSAERLAAELSDIKPADAQRISECAEHYKSAALVQALKDYFEKIVR